ncbi:MAG: PIG-L family deacetylase [Pyrinomonadaceae bacterium]|nr:PIG-L family deacetylase [Pyrinomonadaceae bacterium]
MLRSYVKQLRTDLSRLFAARAAAGPYRFLIRNWQAVSDLELAADVLSIEIFRNRLEPARLPVEKFRSFLVLAPHQDDGVIGAGGTLALARRAKAEIDIIYVTDGEQRGSTFQKIGRSSIEIRKAESKTVCRRLGAGFHELNISNLLPEPAKKDVEKLRDLIAEKKPEVVLTPWLLDSPPKHRMVNHLLRLAEKCGGLGDFEVWGYQVHNSLLPNGFVDITETADEKRELIEIYESQNKSFYRYDHQAMGIAAWNSRYLGRSSEQKFAEIFFALPKAEFLRLVGRFYLKDMNQTYLGEKGLIESLNHLETQF